MEEDVQNALRSQAAFLPGGHDRDAHNLIVVPVPLELHPWTKPQLETCLNYILNSLRSDTKSNGFTVILDAQKCSWRVTRAHIRYLTSCMENHLRDLLVIRPDTFWDTQQVVENCAKSHKHGEPIILSKARLHKYFDVADLPTCLGGTIQYDHDQWIGNRIRFEEFKVLYERASNDLENLHLLLLDNRAVRADETEHALRTCARLNGDVKMSLDATLTNGNQLISLVEDQHRRQRSISPDIIDLAQNIRDMLKELEAKQTNVTLAWAELEKSIQTARELSILEEGVTFVTNWILSTADSLLNDQSKVGYDVKTSEELRMQHDTVEMQCLETYGFYAELLHKIHILPIPKDSYTHSDLMSQKDFMDFVCRSFATRLERRRNVLITSQRFFRLVSEYFDKTSEAFDSLILANKMPDFDKAPKLLKRLKATQQSLETTETELIKEGEKLSDMLAMPVKDALGCDIKLDYSDDIINISDIMDATITRKNIFVDSMELQKLTLQQLIHIQSYEEDLATTITWLTDLYNVLVKCHLYVGVHIVELQHQKDELQTFLDTSKEIYGYGCHLLEGSFTLRQSCKLSVESSEVFGMKLKNCWKKLQDISQEQLTRLRVSAVFHRSIDDYSAKLIDLRASVTAITDDTCDLVHYEEEEREAILKKYLALRERLLVDVGRTVRLGRLLKTRLKETLSFDDQLESTGSSSAKMASSSDSNKTVVLDPDNSVASEAITAKLNQVAQIAESLDSTLMDAGVLCKSVDPLVVDDLGKVDDTVKLLTTGNGNLSDEARSSSDQESAVTAPLWNPQSRSSSYHTASECRSSPWWDSEKNSDLEVENPGNIRRVRPAGTSSASNSFDGSDDPALTSTSFRSPVSMVVVDESDESIKISSQEPSVDEEDSSSTISQHSRKGSVIRIEEVPEDTITDPRAEYIVDGASGAVKVSSHGTEQPDFMAWNRYYQNLINKQTIRSCL